MSRRAWLAGMAAALALACAAREQWPAAPPIATLDEPGLAKLRSDFNAASGERRVLVLLSPT